jgi:putative endonuclease
MKKEGYIYILTNTYNQVLYTGVTSNLSKRISEHKLKLTTGFTKKYNCSKLVYYELCDEIQIAIEREKQIKSGSRKKKLDLINKMNPKWLDLSSQVVD